MAEGKYTYTDRLDFPSTLMFIVRQMGVEAGAEGFQSQFEDIVDLLCFCLSPFIDEAGRKAEWEAIEKEGFDIPITDSLNFQRSKRKRIRSKLLLCFEVMQKNKLLLKRVQEFGHEFDYTSLDKGEDI